MLEPSLTLGALVGLSVTGAFFGGDTVVRWVGGKVGSCEGSCGLGELLVVDMVGSSETSIRYNAGTKVRFCGHARAIYSYS